MTLTDLLNGAGRVVQAAALGLAVYGCGGADESKKLYIWPAGNCDQKVCTILTPSGLPDTSPEEAAATYGFTRNFTQSDLSDEEGCYEKLDNYQCALASEPSLYVYRESNGICLRDNLVLMTNRSCPGIEECNSYVLNSSWYKACFGDEEP